MAHIKFSKNLDQQEIYANGLELKTILGQDRTPEGTKKKQWPDTQKKLIHTIQNPVLVTNLYEIGKLDHTQRETTSALILSPNRTVEYNNTIQGFNNKDYPGVWGPSIDTLFLCQHLTDKNIEGEVLEPGSGSGFISQYLLEHNPKITRLTAIDLDPNAKACTTHNIQDPRLNAQEEDVKKFLLQTTQQYDLIVTNPPYVPREREQKTKTPTKD